MEVKNYINIDLTNKQNLPTLDAVQGDSETRVIVFSLFQNGTPFEIPDGAAVAIAYSTPDGKRGMYDTLPDGESAYSVYRNELSVVLVRQALLVAGNVELCVLISSETKQISTFKIMVNVEESPSAGAIEPEDYISLSGWIATEVERILSDYDFGGVNNGTVADYVQAESDRVVYNLVPKIAERSIVFIAGSDPHYMADDEANMSESSIKQNQQSTVHAGQAMKLISDSLSLDFLTVVGDFAWGSYDSTFSNNVHAIVESRRCFADAIDGVEHFLTPGNHDPLAHKYATDGIYLHDGILTALLGTYRFVDFEKKKVRVICLNTAETGGTTEASSSRSSERMSGEQMQWFAESLDLSGKENPSEWGIIILSHHPLDWGKILPAANLLQAYLTGSEYSSQHDGFAVSYNFAGKNKATVIAQFHGHVHGFKVDYIHYKSGDSMLATIVKRVAIPNICFTRNNEYGNNNRLDTNGLEFGEEQTYQKVADSAQDTAFCVIAIDLDGKKIYADHYGAGYDRIIAYGDAVLSSFSVTNSLTNVSNRNTSGTVVEGSTYSAILTADDGYAIRSVIVTMGGVDVTAQVYSSGVITIPSVTGDIVITAIAVEESGNYTNLVPTATVVDGTDIYNGVGYKDGYRITSGIGESKKDGYTITGVMPYASDAKGVYPTIYIKGCTLDTTDINCRWTGISLRTDTGVMQGTEQLSGNAKDEGNQFATHFTIDKLVGTDYYRLTPIAGSIQANVAYMMMSLKGSGVNLVVTLNEPIE